MLKCERKSVQTLHIPTRKSIFFIVVHIQIHKNMILRANEISQNVL